MPWCPQCGAEYREGLTACAKCQAALVEERPLPAPRRDWREPLRPVVQRLLRDVTAAGACALEALRVFRRHPSLLLVPALLAFANVGVREATHFVYSRESSPEHIETLTGPTWPPVDLSFWPREQLLASYTIGDFRNPIPTPSLTPIVGAWWVIRYSSASHGSPPPVTRGLMAASLLVDVFVDIALGAVILAGYYGIACALVSTGGAAHSSFRANVRRHWVRFFQVGIITWALLNWLPLLYFLPAAETLLRASLLWVAWVAPLASFFFALPLYVLVLDGGSALAAIRRSVFIVATHLAEMAALLAGFALARALVLWPLLLLSERFDLGRAIVEGGTLQSRSVLWGASLTSAFLVNAWTTVLGVWLCLTMFCWYCAVTRQPASATSAAPAA